MQSGTEKIDIAELIELKGTGRCDLGEINHVLSCLIDGVIDPACVLFALNGTTHILEKIWNLVTEYWRGLIQFSNPIDVDEEDDYFSVCYPDESYVLEVSHPGDVQFPEPSNICINMMPFVMERTFEDSKLPEYLKPYWNEMINKCYYSPGSIVMNRLISHSEVGKVGYLTIHEGYVEKGESQRRPGIHTETPGKILVHQNEDGKWTYRKRNGSQKEELPDEELSCDAGEGFSEPMVVGWGFGERSQLGVHGGIFMASNVANSCSVWNCSIQPDIFGNEIIGEHGCVEHLREFLPCKEKTMEENCMYWLTDRTPHKSLPLTCGTYRQYFRLVTSEVSVWFEEHSTPNPLGVVPDPEKTKIIKGSKFC